MKPVRKNKKKIRKSIKRSHRAQEKEVTAHKKQRSHRAQDKEVTAEKRKEVTAHGNKVTIRKETMKKGSPTKKKSERRTHYIKTSTRK